MNAETDEIQSDRPHLERLREVSFRPVFIMGDHRSGTTLLYRLLDATGAFNVVTAYHVIEYDRILHHHFRGEETEAKRRLQDRFDALGLANRVIDGVEVTPDLPEEYGFALRDGSRPRLSPRTLPRFTELCRKIQLSAGNGKPILLKNPWDSWNFLYVREVFPESRFIFLHRNPVNTINSQIKAMRSLMAGRNAYVALIGEWYDRLFEQPLRLRATRLLLSSRLPLAYLAARRHVERVTRYYVENESGLAPSQHVSVRYEDLCEKPGETVRRILDSLRLAETAEVEYDSWIAVRHAKLLDEVERRRPSLLARMRPYLDRCGYLPPETR